MYIRIKHRKNKGGREYDYAYLVQWKWRTHSYAQQHHLRYLGRIHSLPKQYDLAIPINYSLDQQTLLKDLIRRELHNHGFTHDKHTHLYKHTNYYVDLHKGIIYDRNGKEIVLQLNAGFLCTHSLNNLLNYTLLKNDPKDIKAFAKMITLTGIHLEPDEFVHLYQALTHHDLA